MIIMLRIKCHIISVIQTCTENPIRKYTILLEEAVKQYVWNLYVTIGVSFQK